MKRVVVIGAGVVGMTSAYALVRKGYSVTVIDTCNTAAEGASFANGAQLSYSYTDALASPSIISNIPKYVLGLDPAFRLSVDMSPSFMRWMLAFLGNANAQKFQENTLSVLRLALESHREFENIREKLKFDHQMSGKIILYSNYEALDKAARLCELKNAYGVDLQVLTPEEALKKEPALSEYKPSYVGAIWSPFDQAGDSKLFCHNLLHLLKIEYGVTFRFNTTVERMKIANRKLVAITTNNGEIETDFAVIAAGNRSSNIVKTIGLKLPIQPMQGYSITAAATNLTPTSSITDAAKKLVFCKLGNRVRIAGLADMGSGVGRFKKKRFETLVSAAKEIFPLAADYSGELNPWTGLRPMTPDGKPIIGPTNIDGLYLNCGHGSLGWTLSMGSAARLAALLP